jgi:hypothetical protein
MTNREWSGFSQSPCWINRRHCHDQAASQDRHHFLRPPHPQGQGHPGPDSENE